VAVRVPFPQDFDGDPQAYSHWFLRVTVNIVEYILDANMDGIPIDQGLANNQIFVLFFGVRNGLNPA